MNSRVRKTQLILTIIPVTAVMLVTTMGGEQEGVGGRVIHRPELGCACVMIPENETKSSQGKKPAVKLSEEQCKKNGDVATIYNGGEVDTKARILQKPQLDVSSSDGASGRVVLKAILCPNGSVGRVGIVIGVSDEINESAIKAARKIRFEAALKGGQRVAQYIQLEYTFPTP